MAGTTPRKLPTAGTVQPSRAQQVGDRAGQPGPAGLVEHDDLDARSVARRPVGRSALLGGLAAEAVVVVADGGVLVAGALG